MPSPAPTPTANKWVWNPTLRAYHHAAGGIYALPSTDGGEWTCLTWEGLAARGGAGTGMGPSTGAVAGTSTAASTSVPNTEMEEGEVEDDVGWGGLMDPEKLARVVAGAAPAGDGAATGARGTQEAREWGRYGHPQDAHTQIEERRNGHDPYGRRDADADEPAPTPEHILRLVVRRSTALPHGGVALLDARPGGIQLGRDRRAAGDPARVRVREMEVSKTHALVYWGREGRVGSPDEEGADADAEGWWIVDLGSTLGTYVAHRGEAEATRLSEPKHASTPYPLRHLSRVTVGTTTFAAHVHADWPCGECALAGAEEVRVDDGAETPEGSPAPAALETFDAPVGAAARRGQRQFKRKLAMDALRDTLLGEEGRAPARGAYVDRSAQRRRLHPPSPPRGGRGSASPAPGAINAPAMPAGPSAVSRAMLARQGWTPGAGLGRDAGGRAEPVVAVLRNERVGLGARGQVADQGDGAGGDWRSRGKQRRWDEVARG